MWNIGGYTQNGFNMVITALGDDNLTFTSGKAGHGFYSAEEITNATEITAPGITAGIIRATPVTDENGKKCYNVTIRVTSAETESNVVIKQIGLYGRLTADTDDTLLAIIQDNIGISVPAFSDAPQFYADIDVVMSVSNGAKITFEYTGGVLATLNELNAETARAESVENGLDSRLIDVENTVDGIEQNFIPRSAVIDELTEAAANEQLLNARALYIYLQNLIATIPAGGLKTPVELDFESDLPATGMTNGDYYFIQNMNVTSAGHTGRAWYNDEQLVNGSGWHVVIDEYLSPDGSTINTNNSGQLQLADGAVTTIKIANGTNISGNAATATKLATARTIAVSGKATGTATNFDGTAAITIPITALSQTASDYPTLNQSTTGNAATATKLATARAINGVNFDGTGNITIADSTKLPLSGGTLTGEVSFNTTSTPGAIKPLMFKKGTADGCGVLYSGGNGMTAVCSGESYGVVTKIVEQTETVPGTVDIPRITGETLGYHYEDVFIAADQGVLLETNTQTPANRKAIRFDQSGAFYPLVNEQIDLGTSAYKFNNIYGKLKGNADTATKFTTARTINVNGSATATVGGVSGTAQNFDGSANVTITASVPAATASAAGVMLPAEKTKLNNISSAGHGRQIFTENGTFTLIANTPYNIICMGAGGNGGGGRSSTNSSPGYSGGGGGSGYFKRTLITVTVNTTVNVTIGAATGNAAAGVTSFGSYLSAAKGNDGVASNYGGGNGGNGGEKGSYSANSASHGACMTHGCINAQGVYDAETQSVSEWEYGTRQSGYGAGGQGGFGTSTGSAINNGGSGGCGFVMPNCPNGGTASGTTGGIGAPGVCVVEW